MSVEQLELWRSGRTSPANRFHVLSHNLYSARGSRQLNSCFKSAGTNVFEVNFAFNMLRKNSLFWLNSFFALQGSLML